MPLHDIADGALGAANARVIGLGAPSARVAPRPGRGLGHGIAGAMMSDDCTRSTARVHLLSVGWEARLRRWTRCIPSNVIVKFPGCKCRCD